jgi:amino acid transporter
MVFTQENKVGHLRKNAISVIGAVALAMAFMGPATSVFFNTQPAAGGVGYALPFALVLGLIVSALVASAIGAFAKKIPTAGFAYTFNTHGFGKRGGFMSGWILAFAYAMVGPMLLAAIGALTEQFILSITGVDIPWWAFTIIFAIIIWGIGIGLLWAILFFIGFESAGTLGEETQHPRRSIPVALFTAVGIIGLFYVLSGWAASIGFGSNHVNAMVNDPIPWVTLTRIYWGPNLVWLVSLTVLNSIFANLISGINAAVRVLFAMGREGILPRNWSKTTAKGNPSIALTLYMIFALAFALIGGALWTPLGAYAFFGTILGLGIVLIYILINLALIVFYRRDYPSEFSLVRHGILPIVASIIMLLPIYGLLWPVPAYPNNLVPYIMLAWIVIGGIYLFVISNRRPELLDAMGRAMVEEESGAVEQANIVAQ